MKVLQSGARKIADVAVRFIRKINICYTASSNFELRARGINYSNCGNLSTQLLSSNLCRLRLTANKPVECTVGFHTSFQRLTQDGEKKSLMIRAGYFDNVDTKNKETFLQAIDIFLSHGGQRRGHVEFIYAALNYMEEFGVQRDLETYKKLLDVFPKGKYVSRNMWQVEFMHYPKQQQCAIDVLDEMEGNGVIPDVEMQDLLLATFGTWSFPSRKYKRMMYWMPKFKNMSPWPLPDPLPVEPIELAKLAIARMSSVDLETKISIFEAEKLPDAIDHTWIVSAQSPMQKKLLSEMKEKSPVYVEGTFIECLKYHMVSYFILRAEPKPFPKFPSDEEIDDVSNIPLYMCDAEDEENNISVIPSVHEQEDGVVLAMCATGTSSKDSVLSWIRFLQEENPRLSEIPVVFTLKTPSSELIVTDSDSEEEKKQWKPPVNQQGGFLT